MSDLNSSLPIRTETNGDVAVKIVDGTITSQALAVDAAGKVEVKLDDSAGNGITSQSNGGQRALDVGIDVGGIQVDPRDIRALTSSDTVTAVQATASSLNALVEQGAANSIANAWPVKPTDGTNSQAFTASGESKVDITQPLPAGSNAIGSILANLQVSNSAVTVSNPVPVTITSATPGTPVQDYHTSAALAAGASITLTYTVPSGYFSFERMWCSASGKIKAVIKNNGSTIAVGFNSTSSPNIDFTVIAPPSIAVGNTASVIITNEDKQAFDVYATFEGNLN